jgi:exopolysaccharide production protein ExoZ
MPAARPLDSLQASRAVAATTVVLFHANGILSEPKYLGYEVAPIFRAGDSGVSLFFVLSGLVMWLAHRNDFGRPGAALRFLWKRFRRIYPPMWITLVLILIPLLLVPAYGPPGSRDPLVIFGSFVAWPASSDPLLGIEWTLRHEVIFYIALAAAIAWPRIRLVGAVVALATSAFGGLLPFPLSFIFSPYNFLFVSGLVVGWLHGRRQDRPAPLSLALGLLVFAAVWVANCLRYTDTDHSYLGYGAGAALILYGLANTEASGRLRIPRWLAFVGDASYSIYLVHFPVLSICAKLTHGRLPPLAIYAVCVPVAISGGIAFYWFVERNLLKALPSSLTGRTQPAAAPPIAPATATNSAPD